MDIQIGKQIMYHALSDTGQTLPILQCSVCYKPIAVSLQFCGCYSIFIPTNMQELQYPHYCMHAKLISSTHSPELLKDNQNSNISDEIVTALQFFSCV